MCVTRRFVICTCTKKTHTFRFMKSFCFTIYLSFYELLLLVRIMCKYLLVLILKLRACKTLIPCQCHLLAHVIVDRYKALCILPSSPLNRFVILSMGIRPATVSQQQPRSSLHYRHSNVLSANVLSVR